MRTTLRLVPAVLVATVVVLFVATELIGHAAYDGCLSLPSWAEQSSADAAHELLSAIAAAVITVEVSCSRSPSWS